MDLCSNHLLCYNTSKPTYQHNVNDMQLHSCGFVASLKTKSDKLHFYYFLLALVLLNGVMVRDLA